MDAWRRQTSHHVSLDASADRHVQQAPALARQVPYDVTRVRHSPFRRPELFPVAAFLRPGRTATQNINTSLQSPRVVRTCTADTTTPTIHHSCVSRVFAARHWPT